MIEILFATNMVGISLAYIGVRSVHKKLSRVYEHVLAALYNTEDYRKSAELKCEWLIVVTVSLTEAKLKIFSCV